MPQSSLLSPSQLSQLRAIFQRYDKTGAGSLSSAEVAKILRIACSEQAGDGSGSGAASGSSVSSNNSSITDLMIRDLLTEVDVGEEGGEGRCDFEEFVNLFCRRRFGISTSSHTTADESIESSTSSSSSAMYLATDELYELKDIFRSMDIDGDQLLSAKDLQQVFRRIGDNYDLAELDEMIREVDSTRSGKIKLADFLAAMSPAA